MKTRINKSTKKQTVNNARRETMRKLFVTLTTVFILAGIFSISTPNPVMADSFKYKELPTLCLKGGRCPQSVVPIAYWYPREESNEPPALLFYVNGFATDLPMHGWYTVQFPTYKGGVYMSGFMSPTLNLLKYRVSAARFNIDEDGYVTWVSRYDPSERMDLGIYIYDRSNRLVDMDYARLSMLPYVIE